MEQVTATPQGVEEKEIVVGNTERNNMVAEIAERARKERDEELKAAGHDVVDTSGKEKVKGEENALQQEEPKADEEVKEEVREEIKAGVKEEPKPETVRIKVDGEEREVPKEKIYDAGIRAMQKESTADKRLEEATRLLREIEQKYAQPQEKKQEAPSPQWDDATVAYALEHGTEEQKAYAISLLRGRGDTTQEDLQKVKQEAVKTVLDTVDFRDASQWFLSEYKDIAGDPYLIQLASIAEDKARASGDQRTRKELYKQIGEDLRKWKGGVVPANSMEDKKELKSKIINLPSASVKKSTPAEAKPKTTSDIIEEMRKKRGQV